MYPVRRGLAGLLLLLLPGLALAHPMGSDMNGHRLELQLEPEELRADYLVEVPTQRMVRDLRSFLASRPAGTGMDAFAAAFEEELQGGLRLLVNGAPTRWERLSDEAPRESDSRYVTARLLLRAALPADARTVQVVNGNLPDVQSLFLVSVQVSERLVVDDCSLWERGEDGRVARDRDGQWRMEERSRDVALSFRPRAALGLAALRWTRRLGGGGEGPLAPSRELAADAPLYGLDRRGAGLLAGALAVLALGIALARARLGGRS